MIGFTMPIKKKESELLKTIKSKCGTVYIKRANEVSIYYSGLDNKTKSVSKMKKKKNIFFLLLVRVSDPKRRIINFHERARAKKKRKKEWREHLAVFGNIGTS